MVVIQRIVRNGAGASFLLLASLLAGCSGLAASHVNKGDALFEKHAYQAAVDEYNSAVRYQPSNARAIRQLGLAYNLLGKRTEARAFLEKSKKLDPKDTDVRLALGSLDLFELNADAAIQEANAALAAKPGDAQGLNLLGAAYLAKGDTAGASAAFRRLVDAAPSNPRTHYMLASALLANQRIADATAEYEQALKLDPSYIDPLSKLVDIAVGQGRFDDALALVNRQISIAGDSAAFHTLLGSIYVRRNTAPDAEREFRKAIATSPRFSDAYARLAGLYRSQGKLDSAVAIGTRAVQLDSTNLPARIVLGVAYQQLGDIAKAEGQYQAALAVNPTYAAAANNLAFILADRGTAMERALQLAAVARTSDPANPEIMDTYGWILYKVGNYKQAAVQLAQAAARLPDDAAVQYHFGMASAKAGDTTSARQAFQRAMASKANPPEKTQAQRALAALK